MRKKIFLITISFLILAAIDDGSLFVLAQQKDTNNKKKAIVPVKYTGAQYRDPLELPIELRTPIKPVKPVIETTLEPVLEEVKEVEIEKEIVLPTFTIQGMVWGGIKPQALINGQLCEKGDTIRGAEITDINKEGVTFVYKDKKFLFSPTVELHKIAEKRDEYGIEEEEYRREEEYQIEPIEPAE